MKLNYTKKRKPKTEFEAQFRNYQYTQKPELKFEAITDSEGLSRACSHGDHYIHGKTMYIAGNHTLSDWYDDFTKVPVWGDLRNSERYQKTREPLKNRSEIDNVVGHSLGGVVALEMQQHFADRIKNSRTYGAPV